MKTKLLIIAVFLVICSVIAFASCDKSDVENGDVTNQNILPTVNPYAVDGAKMSTPESRLTLEEKYKELQTLYNLAVDTVAKTEGPAKEQVKDIGARFIDLLKNKVASTDYVQYEAFVQDAVKEIESIRKELISVVPSIAN